MAVYLGNQLIGNGLYLGNENYRDSNVFVPVDTSNPVKTGRILEVNNTAASYPGTGTVWYDVSGNGYDINTINSPTWTTVDGWALNGTNQFLSGSTALSNGLNSAWNSSAAVRNGITIIVDCFKNANGSEGSLFAGWVDSPTLLKILFEINSNQTIESAVNVTPSGIYGANTTGTITTNARSIMAMVIPSDGVKTIYTNNSALAGTQSVPNENWVADAPFYRFGARGTIGAPSSYFAGKIKAIVAYNRGLNSTELTSVYNYLLGL